MHAADEWLDGGEEMKHPPQQKRGGARLFLRLRSLTRRCDGQPRLLVGAVAAVMVVVVVVTIS